MKEELQLYAITGGIGSGKSLALRTLKENGYKTLSCDEITGELYKKRKILKRLKRIFPNAITGKIILKADKKEIARQVFSDKELYKKLSQTLTVPTYDRAVKKAKRLGGKVFIEVPLLFEYNLQDSFDNVIVVFRSLPDRIESVKKRSGLSEDEIMQRINSQFDYEKADLSKYVVINNDGDKTALKTALLSAVNNVIK